MASNAYKNTWDNYTKSWSETDVAKRLQLFEQCLSPLIAYTQTLSCKRQDTVSYLNTYRNFKKICPESDL